MAEKSWGQVAAKRNKQDIRKYRAPNPVWLAPQKGDRKQRERQEFDQAGTIKRDMWGREEQFDTRGRQVGKKKRGWFGDGFW